MSKKLECEIDRIQRALNREIDKIRDERAAMAKSLVDARPDPMEFSRRARSAVRRRGLTQALVATMVGVSGPMVSRWMAGEDIPSKTRAEAFALAVDDPGLVAAAERSHCARAAMRWRSR